MKYPGEIDLSDNAQVAPFTGAWIEIGSMLINEVREEVAPFTGAWIEISSLIRFCFLPNVAPFTGAWIEISSHSSTLT